MIVKSGMPPQQYCLRWNNHRANLLTVFDELLRNESFTDVTLVCEDGISVKCHKMVLAACSSYFQCVFSELPCRHPVVVLKDIRYVEIKAILEYMYRGEVSIAQDQLAPLLKVAEALKVKGLVEENSYKTKPPISEEEMNAISTSSMSTLENSSHNHHHRTATPIGMPMVGGNSRNRDMTQDAYENDSTNNEFANSSIRRNSSPNNNNNNNGNASSNNNNNHRGVNVENCSPPHSTGIHHQAFQKSYPYTNNRLSSRLPWPMTSLPVSAPQTPTAAMFNNYESVISANGSDLPPLRRKKLSSFLMNKDTPILRTVLGQGQADSSQPMSLVCHPDSQDHIPQSNGPTTPQDMSYIKNKTKRFSHKQDFQTAGDKGQRQEWKRYKQYTKDDILSAIEAVRKGMSPILAAKKYGVPSRTLYDKIKRQGVKRNRKFNQITKPNELTYSEDSHGGMKDLLQHDTFAKVASVIQHTPEVKDTTAIIQPADEKIYLRDESVLMYAKKHEDNYIEDLSINKTDSKYCVSEELDCEDVKMLLPQKISEDDRISEDTQEHMKMQLPAKTLKEEVSEDTEEDMNDV